ncbi:MAG: hypothetical protein WC592_03010 [Candidatus Omnitrophota bacterium]|nr:hypothetical protein [Candidatus Omnitrophota bacterium]
MKKIAFILLALVFAAGVTGTASALTIDQTKSVTATGSVAGVTSLAVDVTSIAYGEGATDRYPTAPKIKLTYSSNYNPWKIMVSTNNTTIPMQADDGLYAKGGLVTGTGTSAHTAACKWVTKIGTSSTTPALPTATAYNYVKDIRDEDDPATGGGQDESWAAALAGGYPVIAFGDASGNGYCIDPTNSAPGDFQYTGDAITEASGVAVYIAAGFATNFVDPAIKASAGSYATTFVFDLIHE